MCAKLLTCPLCSQPGFLTLDALRAGLISAATRPLICPVCNEVLLGMDKLTIHLFSHTINLNHLTDSHSNDHDVRNNSHVPCDNIQTNVLQEWNMPKTQLSEVTVLHNENVSEKCSETNAIVLETHQNVGDTINYDNIVNPKSAQNNIQMVQTNRQEYQGIWMGNFNQCEQYVTKESESMNENKSQVNVIEIVDTNIRKDNKTKETVKLNGKEKESSQFLTFSNVETMMSRANIEQTINDGSLRNVKEINTNDKIQSESSNDTNVLPLLKSFRISSKQEKTERCDICGFHFPDNNILILHKELVHMINQKDLDKAPGELFKSYSCHLCSKVFKMRGSLMIHMRVAHTGYNSGTLTTDGEAGTTNDGYNCPTCGKKFRKEQHVIQHLKTHEGKQWECEVCSKMFTTKYFLKKHKRLHSGEMPYKCNICDKTFTFQQSYHKHRLYHKDDKPHTCITCGRSFKELSTLHNHERIHTGEKPFACETCGKCFRQRVSYLVHRRIHTGVMPYKCTLCDKSFRYKVSQRTHKCPARQAENITQQLPSLVHNLMQMSTVSEANNKEYHEVQSLEPIRSNQSLLHIPNNEDNKFVLIINSQGQHVLTKESTVANEQSMSKEQMKDKNMKNDLWNSHDSCKDETKNSNMIQSESESTCVEMVNDFLSMVMTPVNNDTQITSEIDRSDICPSKEKNNTSKTIQLNTISVGIEESYNCDNNVTNTLETINEESLKQLLHSIDKK